MFNLVAHIDNPILVAYIDLQIILLILSFAYSLDDGTDFKFKRVFEIYIKHLLFSTLAIPLLYVISFTLIISEHLGIMLKTTMYIITLFIINIHLSVLYKHIWARSKDFLVIFNRMSIFMLTLLLFIMFILIIFKVSISL